MLKYIIITITLMLSISNLFTKELEFYTVRYSDQMLCKINTKGTIAEIGKISIPVYKYFGLDFNKTDGNCYIANNSVIYKLDIETGKVDSITKLTKKDYFPNGIAYFVSINSKGEFYIFIESSAVLEGKLYKLDDINSGLLSPLSTNTSGMASILGIEFDDEDNLWNVDECCSNAINKFNLSNGLIDSRKKLTKRLSFPTDLDYVNGEMYFFDIKSEFNSNTTDLYKVDLETGQLTLVTTFNYILAGLTSYKPKPVIDTCEYSAFKYEDFSNKSELNLQGNAVEYDGIIRLTKEDYFQKGLVSYKDKVPVNVNFKTKFTFRIANGDNFGNSENSYPGADGLALFFYNNNKQNIGFSGGGIGYEGIENGVAIELDLFQNEDENYNDKNGNHLAIFGSKDIVYPNHNSNQLIFENLDIPELTDKDGDYEFLLEYSYDNKVLKISLDNNSNSSKLAEINDFDFSDYMDLEGGNFATIAITASTGVCYQRQEILSWEFCAEDFIQSIDSKKDEIKYYPNPVNSNLNIELPFIASKVEIYNLFGEKVITVNKQSDKYNILVNNLNSGVYFAKIQGNNIEQNIKFIVE